MPYNKEQKIKLLLLYDILCRKTDEEHVLSTEDIISELSKLNIELSRKTLPQDIELLNEYGYEVLSYKKKHNYYYVVDRKFENAEVTMLSDVIKASKLNHGQKSSLIQKLTEQLGEHKVLSIAENILNYDMPMHSNSHIIYSVDAISTAIDECKQISFLYYSLDYKKNKVYRRDGKRYIVNPLFMVWSKDNYYLVCYRDDKEGTANYRIDRMEDVRIESISVSQKAEFENMDIEKHKTQMFSMFGGETETVELEFTGDMLDDIFDKFGENIKVQKTGDDTYRVFAQIQVSPTFFSWVAGSCGKMRIITPAKVKDQFDLFVEQIKIQY